MARDGSVIVAMFAGRPNVGDLYLVPPRGGDPSKLDVPGLGEAGMFFWPEFLPDGKNILFAWADDGEGDVGLYLATLEAGKFTRRPILLRRNMTTGHYSAMDGGKLLYVQNNKLYAQTLSVTRAVLEGPPEPVLDGVQSAPTQHRAIFSISQNGVLVWHSGTDGLAQPTWFDRTGKVLGTTGPPCLPDLVELSPDGKRVLLRTVAHDSGYGIAESNRNGFVPLPGITDGPLWMPRTSHVMYRRKEGGSYRLFERAAEGGVEKELRPWPGGGSLIDVSPDEKTLLYHAGPRLYSLRLDDPSSAPQLLANAVLARFSPDGHWIVYMQGTSESTEVLVQPFPSGGLPTQLTPNGGEDPVWRGDGQEIFYRKGSKIYAVKVHVSGSSFSAGAPEALFDVRVPSGMIGDSMPMDVSRDGSRILFAQGSDKADSQITYVTTDWTSARHR
jgi:Tol biopolymer transport system component